MDILSKYRLVFKPQSSLRFPLPVILLTTLIIMSSCSGGGGGNSGPSGAPGASGQVCLVSSESYTIDEEGLNEQTMSFEEDPLLTLYQGNIGGQIRAVDAMNIALPGQEAMNLLIWGSGASVKYGTAEGVLGTANLRNPGAVTGLAAIRANDEPKIIYSTERGLGIAEVTSEGVIQDVTSAYRRVGSGVLSVAADGDGDRIVYTTGDGYLEDISVSDLESGEACSSILSSARVLEAGERDYLPVKVDLTSERAFVLARLKSIIPSTAPTLEQVYDGIFAGMVVDIPTALVRGVDLDDHEIHEVEFDAADDSFHFYDSFVPTDISTDGTNLYVIGIAYKKSAMEGFIVANCEGSGQAAQVECVREAAKSGTLTSYAEEGIFSFNAGFFIYRNAEDLSKADHFVSLPIAAFMHDNEAPPFFYRMVVDGDVGYIRGPNFMVAMSRETTASGDEDWHFTAEIDGRTAELKSGIPNDMVSYAGGAAASFTAVRAQDGTGASAVELMGSDGSFSVVDTGAIFVRVEGGGNNSVAAIEMASGSGGNLYIENATERNLIGDMGYSNAFVSQAAYNGTLLSFIWSTRGDDSSIEAQQGWRLEVQRGTDADSRGVQNFIARTGDPKKFFDSFPTIEADDSPSVVRGIGDLAFDTDGSKIIVMLTGYKGGVWYHQLGMFGYINSEGKYRAKFSAVSKTQKKQGSSLEHAGRILRARKLTSKYEIVFSTSDGVYKWLVAPGTEGTPGEGSVTKLFSVEDFIDASADALGGNKIAIVSGYNISIKDLSKPSEAGVGTRVARAEGSTLSKLIGARVSLAGSLLSIATPYGASSPFSIYTVGASGAPALTAACASCRFLDVNVFKSFPDYLLTSSVTSGIEIYSTRAQ
jgi:hypothetical protein